MKILLIHDEINTKGGASVYTRELRSALERKGHKVKIFSYDNMKSKKNNLLFFNLRLYLRIKREIKNFRPEVIHIQNTHKFQNSVYLTCFGKNVVKTFHDYWAIYPLDGLSNKKNSIRELFGIMIERYFLKKMKIISPSEELRQEIENIGIDSFHIDYFSRIKPLKRKKKEKSLLFVGYFHEGKGLHVLLKSFEFLEKNGGWKLTFVGDGPYKIKKGKNIRIINWLDKENLRKIYSESKIIVIPSRVSETGPIVLLEAMTFGIPVIGSNVPGIREKIKENKCGILFNSEDSEDLKEKIIYLQGNKKKYEEISKNAKNNSKKYSIENHIEKLMKIYLA